MFLQKIFAATGLVSKRNKKIKRSCLIFIKRIAISI